MEAIPVLTGLVGKQRRGRKGHRFSRLTRWYYRKKPPHLEQKFTDELKAYSTLTLMAEERLMKYYRRFKPLAIVGAELDKHGGYDMEETGEQRVDDEQINEQKVEVEVEVENEQEVEVEVEDAQ
ncbi:hypothetical protein LWI28_010339 [Acer negundo]|uniref:Uncharacterized protein n=1 Tax=Acer negundo TaxID=4023 RepID=A0AAD5I5Q3_ACENE|nr:hypothetical protein LWI28_010339 [Acer negundo]